MERWDAEFTGAVVMVGGVSVLLLTALAATVPGVDVGRYGSAPPPRCSPPSA